RRLGRPGPQHVGPLLGRRATRPRRRAAPPLAHHAGESASEPARQGLSRPRLTPPFPTRCRDRPLAESDDHPMTAEELDALLAQTPPLSPRERPTNPPPMSGPVASALSRVALAPVSPGEPPRPLGPTPEQRALQRVAL